MKKIVSLFVILFALLAFTSVVLAEDVVLNTTVERAIVKKDKNGNAYVRVLIQDKRELNGVTYDKTTSVMAFGDQVTAASKLKKGDTLKAIVAKSEFRGGVSYQLLKITP